MTDFLYAAGTIVLLLFLCAVIAGAIAILVAWFLDANDRG